MVFPKARLVVSAGLFLAWIGFLVFLVVKTRNPVILSRPQLLASSLVVIVQVEDKGRRPPTVTVKEVLRSRPGEEAKLVGTQLSVYGLLDCGPKQGWAGAGEYIVPLVKHEAEGGPTYQVTPLPLSPGYYPQYVTVEIVSLGNESEAHDLANKHLRIARSDGKIGKGIVRRNVPRSDAEAFQREMEAAGSKVALREGETRIYRNTPDAREQVDEIKLP